MVYVTGELLLIRSVLNVGTNSNLMEIVEEYLKQSKYQSDISIVSNAIIENFTKGSKPKSILALTLQLYSYTLLLCLLQLIIAP